jgi:hypothetical protein
MQSVTITTNVVKSNHAHGEEYSIQMLRTGRQFLLHILWYRTKFAKTIRRISIITIYLTTRTIYNREFDTCAMDTYISYSESISHIAFNSIGQYMNMRAWNNGILKPIGVVWINNMEQCYSKANRFDEGWLQKSQKPLIVRHS